MKQDDYGLGGWSVDPALYEKIREICPTGVLVELGSGKSTPLLAQHYDVCSVEHDERFLLEGPYRQIHAPIKAGWYDAAALSGKLPRACDVLLVDGPPGHIGRLGLLRNLSVLPEAKAVVVDDAHRGDEQKLCSELFWQLKMRRMERFAGRLGKTEFVVLLR